MARPPLWILWTVKQNLPHPWLAGWRRTVGQRDYFVGQLGPGRFQAVVTREGGRRVEIPLGVSPKKATALYSCWVHWTGRRKKSDEPSN